LIATVITKEYAFKIIFFQSIAPMLNCSPSGIIKGIMGFEGSYRHMLNNYTIGGAE
jgi:hypothetical protein